MIRRKNSRSLQRGHAQQDEPLDPLASLANIADCMLVLAVGLLVALVAHYGVDLGEQQSEATDASEAQIYLDAKDPDGNDLYEDMGRVYRDSATGQLYIVEQDK